MLFDSWMGLGRVALAALLGYAALIVMLRLSGKRTLAKLNAYDFVITVALGSTLATLVTSRSTPVAEGVFALGMLILLQYAIAWSQVRLPGVQRWIKSEPALLLYRGTMNNDVMRRERVSEEEVTAAIRNAGGTDVNGTLAVVLETDGSLVAICPSTEGNEAMKSIRQFS